MIVGEPYVCSCCGDRCLSAWTEEEARADLAKHFPGVPVENCEIVCDRCDRLLKAFLAEADVDQMELLELHPMQARDVLVRASLAAGLIGDAAEQARCTRLADAMHQLAGRWLEGRQRARQEGKGP